MVINGKRALAHIEEISNIRFIEGADNIEQCNVLGWKLICKKGEFSAGDKCVYIEIDSKVPETEEFEFLRSKGFKVKTMKLSKFGVISQGLALPANLFNMQDLPIGTDVTDKLGIKYSVKEDNERKNGNPNAKYDSMVARKKKLFKKPWAKWMMKRSWGRKIMFLFFGKKRDNPRGFPKFISKTDEERVENQPWRCGDGKQYIATEKLDGTSCTYALERKRFNRFEFYVCSRNVRQKDEKQSCYHDHNIYWDLAFKYDIENKLKQYLNEHTDCKWVCIQGEGVGSVQGNPLKLDHDDLYVFNFITSADGRWNSYTGRELIESFGMKWVPILGEISVPESMEEFKQMAHANSVVNSSVIREGIVCRSLDGSDSFKNVDPIYLLKHNQ